MTHSAESPSSQSPDTLFLDAVACYRRGDMQMALDMACQGLALNASDLRLLNIAGAAALGLRRLDAAEDFWRRAISIQPRSADAYNSLGILLQQAERFSEAEAAFQAALACRPGYAEAHCNLGDLLKQRKRYAEAEATYEAALASRPDYADAFNNFGLLLHEQKRFVAAEQKFCGALACRQNFPAAHTNLGNALKAVNRFSEAEAAYRSALTLRPNYPEASNNLGVLLRELKRPTEAEAAYRQALAQRPDYFEVHYNLGNLLAELRRFPEAETSYLLALERQADAVHILRNLGNVYRETGRFEQAETAYRRALAVQPDFAEAHQNLGVLYQEMKRFDAAEAAYKQAIACKPEDAEAYSNLGALLQVLRRFGDAEHAYNNALKFAPDHADARFNLSLLMLSTGHLAEGWPLYEARYDSKKSRRATHVPLLDFPQWSGEPLQGRSIMIWTEQGLGDEIQFARYAPLLRAAGAKQVTWVCKAPLKRLFQQSGIADVVIAQEERGRIEPHDYWTFPLSIPLHLRTSLATIPAPLPYLKASEENVQKWERAMPQQGTKGRKGSPGPLRIGILWKGSPLHPNDGNRSLPGLATLAPLWSIPGLAFVSLQMGAGMEEALAPPPRQPLLELGSKIEDFADTAAIVACLDLVICIDTAIAHLAGALGKPGWVLLADIGTDWRWLHERADSPWYPDVLRLFRQPAGADWPALVQEVAESLREWAAACSGGSGDGEEE